MTSDVSRELIVLLPRLRRFARGLCNSRDEADDLVQAACERALRAVASFEAGTRLDSWMYRILHNLWIDQVRRGRTLSLEETTDEISGEDGRRTAETRLALADVRARIAELPDEQREVLLLVCVEDMSYRDAAEILGIPIGTVMSRLARARAALSAALEGEREQRSGARRLRP